MTRDIIAMNHEYTITKDDHYIYILHNATGFEIKCFKHLDITDIKRGKQLAEQYGWNK